MTCSEAPSQIVVCDLPEWNGNEFFLFVNVRYTYVCLPSYELALAQIPLFLSS